MELIIFRTVHKRLFLLSILICGALTMSGQETKITVSGHITEFRSPLANVNVFVKGKTGGVFTDANGKYSVQAKAGDILVFSHLAMVTEEVIVEDSTRILNIKMVTEVEELDEIVLKERRSKSQHELRLEFPINKNLLITSFGILDKERSGYALKVLDKKDFNPGATTLIDVVRSRIPGLRVGRIETPGGALETALFIRGGNSILRPAPAAYDIDGQVMTSYPEYLNVANIERIGVIPGLNGVVRYGGIASGGVIVINTKNGTFVKEPGTDKPYDHAKLRNNLFSEKGTEALAQTSVPKYLLQLRSAKTEQEAYEIFKEQQQMYGDVPYFYLDVASYYKNTWKNYDKTRQIYLDIENRFATDPVTLKALAYTYEAERSLDRASDLYRKIFLLRPTYAQSYRDLANIYSKVGDEKKALNLYARYIYARKMDTLVSVNEGIDSIIKTETNNLVMKLADKLPSYISNKENDEILRGTRLVFEWNTSEAEFDLQFVNPANHYYIWNHTRTENRERIKDEKVKGYSSMQFFMDENLPGNWQVNIRYLGNKTYAPTYLKATIITNYGSGKQMEEVKVFKLADPNVNQQLFSVINNVQMATR